MAFINLLHNGYQGKLGETVGQKWKNQRTVRTYNPHNNSKSQAQLTQREYYKELISLASSAYPTRFNFPKSPEKRMNDFNYYTSITKKVEDTIMQPERFYPVDIFNRQDICHPTVYTLVKKNFIYITIPQTVRTIYMKDYKIVIISNLNTDTMQYQPINITFQGIFMDRQFKAGTTAQPRRRGFFAQIDGLPTYNSKTVGAIARKKGSKWEYSAIFNLSNIVTVEPSSLEPLRPSITIIT